MFSFIKYKTLENTKKTYQIAYKIIDKIYIENSELNCLNELL